MSESTHNIYKIEISATHLPIGDISGSSDPYIVFYVNGKEIFRTEFKKQTLCPVWDSIRVYVSDGKLKIGKEDDEAFAINDHDVQLTLKIIDRDFLMPDDFLGKVKLSLKEFLTGGKYDVVKNGGNVVPEGSVLKIEILNIDVCNRRLSGRK